MRYFLLLISIAFITSCAEKKTALFTNLSSSETGIDFKNELKDEEGFDVFRYRNYYNGGGVAIADFNNDQLSDIYFVSNQAENHLYFNEGDLKFKRINQATGDKPWSTGVAVADINGDGWQDIYVCNSGDLKGNDRGNELFINNQDGTFSEKASEFGLDDSGFSTHAVFFDFDHDNDLDCYLLNNSFHPVSSLPIENTRHIRDANGGGDKFYLNDSGKFIDISDSVGVYGSVIGFGLGITLLDVNDDGYSDIYISNDFFERDYLYVNVEGKYFNEELEKYFDQISLFSMGADAADLNNDGFEEIFVTDMLPESKERLKMTTNFETPDLFRLKQSKGFYNQFMKNTLQWNNGDGSFSELGRQMGVSASDWSWGALMMDLDNDGFRDIFVANGIYKDVTDQDFLAYFANEENLKAARSGDEVRFSDFIERMPSTPIPNVVFARDSLGNYVNKAMKWGLAEPSFSNGSAYGDLDNDGDLDLVVNNLNQSPFIYENNSDSQSSNHFLKLSFEGQGNNSFAIGTEVKAYAGKEIISYSHYPVRGFQSSVDYVAVMGLGNRTRLDSLVADWPGGKRTVLRNVPIDTILTLNIGEASDYLLTKRSKNAFLRSQGSGIVHEDSEYDDFDFNRMVYHGLSQEGPAIAVADLNGDGNDDIYMGGSQGKSGAVYINDGNFGFDKLETQLFDLKSGSEEISAEFIDVDNDGDYDLYVQTGGVESSENKSLFHDYLYMNEGWDQNQINWTLSNNLPEIPYSGSVIRPADFDNDGDIDLFLGSRSIPGEYGKNTSSYLWQNDGKGGFEDISSKVITQLSGIGMVTDAAWTDYDNDEDLDLIVVGDWMPVTLFENRGDFFKRKFDYPGFENSSGWWRSIYVKDIDGDGYEDLLLGNLGQNSMFKANTDNPIRLYINDYDDNGMLDHIYTFKSGESFVPFHVRDVLSEQLVYLKKQFTSFADYANKSMDQIFTEEQLMSSIKLDAVNLNSSIAFNQKGNSYRMSSLPAEAQVSPIYEMISLDINGDSQDEIILMGNYENVKPEEAFYDGNHGVVLSFSNGDWQVHKSKDTGLFERGLVRALRILNGKNGKAIFVGKNNAESEVYIIN